MTDYLRPTVLWILEALADHAPLSIPEIAERTTADVRTVRRHVHRLAQARYVEAVPGIYRRRWMVSHQGRHLGLYVGHLHHGRVVITRTTAARRHRQRNTLATAPAAAASAEW